MNPLSSFFSELNTGLASVLSFLPGSPFAYFVSQMEDIPYLPELNWFVPVPEIIEILYLWVNSIFGLYVFRAILKKIHVL